MTDEIIKVIKDNPGIPVYAYVYSEVVGDNCASCSWLGRMTRAKVTEIAEVEPYGPYDCCTVEKDDITDYKEYLEDILCETLPLDISVEDFNKEVQAKLDKLKFKKVILLYIDTF